MPKRPKQHQLEDYSRAKFQLCLPEKWVIRDKDKDYGIDCEVELFDNNNSTLGLLFYVQLKSTDSKKESDIYNIDFSIDTLRYFNQLEIPVILARYSKHLDKIFIKWVNAVDLTYTKENAKTFRIKIDKNDQWSESSANQIENDLRNVKLIKSGLFKFPISYSINIKEDYINEISNYQFKTELRNKLNEYSDFLQYKENKENYLIDISIKQDLLSIQTGIIKGVHFHNFNNIPKEKFFEELSLTTMLCLSMCFIQVGQFDNSGKIIFENNLEGKLIENEELLLKQLPVLLSSSYFENTLNLINEALDKTKNDYLLLSTYANILLKSKTKNKKQLTQIESFFKSRLEKAEKQKQNILIATSHYNLGNFHRGLANNMESIHHYVKAKKYDSSYLKRPYYYREIAGVCFGSNKYWFSSNFYKKSIELGAPIETKSLLADALMFAGKYKVANNIFNEYITESEEIDDEFLLKSILLKMIIKNTKIYSQNRKLEEAEKIAACSPTFENIEEALKKDLLSSVAWFNLGIIKKDNSNYIDATICFAFCGCINLFDIQAWIFAFVAYLKSGSNENSHIGALILKVAYKHNHDEFLSQLYRLLENNLDKNIELINNIDSILTKENHFIKKETVIRIINNDDDINEIKL